MPQVTIFSSNLLLDKELRKIWGGNPSTAAEVKTVVQQALEVPESHEWNRSQDGSSLKLEPKVHFKNGGTFEMQPEDAEVKVKFFPISFEAKAAQNAIQTVLEVIKPFNIDSLQMAVPREAIANLSIGPQPKEKNEAYNECLSKLVDLWKGLESSLDESKVKKFGICDIETVTLEELYGQVARKPASINVNLQSCCVVPPELVSFAKNNNIQVNTHSDPEVLLSDEDLVGTKLHDLGTLNLDWIIRYLIMDQKRGVLKERRFIIGLKSTSQ